MQITTIAETQTHRHVDMANRLEAEAKIKAALDGPIMRPLGAILRKIKTELPLSDFPMTIADLDKHLSGAGLKTAERLALKAAMDRAGLLR
jgi:hypothetical protein